LHQGKVFLVRMTRASSGYGKRQTDRSQSQASKGYSTLLTLGYTTVPKNSKWNCQPRPCMTMDTIRGTTWHDCTSSVWRSTMFLAKKNANNAMHLDGNSATLYSRISAYFSNPELFGVVRVLRSMHKGSLIVCQVSASVLTQHDVS